MWPRINRLGIALILALAVIAAVLTGSLLGGPSTGHGAFPGTNGKIAFDSTFDDQPQGHLTGNYKVYVMNPDGSGLIRLTPGAAYDWDPAWSPDGSKIVFASTRDDPAPVQCWPDCNAEIYVMNADGSNPTRLTNDPAWDSTPSWSPDGTKIAFESYRDSTYPRIFVMNADGSNQTSLIRYGTYPAWSPDGQKIAMGGGDIWVTNPDGSNPVNLTHNSDDNETPSWSPDGTKIAFATWQTGAIHVMNADGSGSTQLTTPVEPYTLDEDPAWSPDGTKIVYVHKTGTSNIWVMNADGSGKTALTACQIDSHARPDWQREPVVSVHLAGVADAFTTAPANLLPGGHTPEISNCIPGTPAPTGTSTPTPAPTATSTPTPVPTPSPTANNALWGDVDCNSGVDAVDALKDLRHVAGLNVSQTPPCPAISSHVSVSGPVGATDRVWGDVDCDGDVLSVDALKILRYVAALTVSQTPPCPAIGSGVEVSPAG